MHATMQKIRISQEGGAVGEDFHSFEHTVQSVTLAKSVTVSPFSS